MSKGPAPWTASVLAPHKNALPYPYALSLPPSQQRGISYKTKQQTSTPLFSFTLSERHEIQSDEKQGSVIQKLQL